MKTHDRLRAQLQTRLGDIVNRIGRIERDLRQQADRDWTEQAILQENDEVLEGLNEMERAEVIAIRGTLRRIDAGEYGRCSRCHGPIEHKRLDAMPTADTCIACAN